MKKNIGSQLALYPMPVTVAGAMNKDKPTWTLVAHVGIIGHDRVLVSLAAPVITKAPLSLECSVEDIYNTPGFESFICTIDNTYVEEEHLNADGKVNYHTLKPVLFEFPIYEYLKTGDVLGKCLSFKENTKR